MGLFVLQRTEAKCIADNTDGVGKCKTSWFLLKRSDIFFVILQVDGFGFFFYLILFSINLPRQRYEGHLVGSLLQLDKDTAAY